MIFIIKAFNNQQNNALAPKHAQGLVWLVFLLIILAESVLAFGEPLWGMVIYGVLLLSLVITSSLVPDEIRVFCSAVLLIPIMRLLAAGLPIGNIELILQNVAVALSMVTAVIIYLRTYRIGPGTIGLSLANPVSQILFGATGVLTGILVATVSPVSFEADGTLYIIHIIIIVWMEEVIFRGVVLKAAEPFMGRFQAIMYSAALYAYMFISVDPILCVLGFVLGLVYGVVASRGTRLLGIILAHSITRIIGFFLLPSLLQ